MKFNFFIYVTDISTFLNSGYKQMDLLVKIKFPSLMYKIYVVTASILSKHSILEF